MVSEVIIVYQEEKSKRVELHLKHFSVILDIARCDECYIGLNGEEQRMKAGDMMMSDRDGITSSVVYGPDHRTRITAGTKRILFVTYFRFIINDNPFLAVMSTDQQHFSAF